MTRAYKLAVTIGGVMALSWGTHAYGQDKPNSSTHIKNNIIHKKNTSVNKTTAAYNHGRDSLEAALKDEALEILQAPMAPVKPIALPVSSFEKYVLENAKTKEMSFADSNFTFRYMTQMRSFSGITFVRTLPFIDTDELLHEAEKDSVDYIRYTSFDNKDYLLATQDLKTLRDDYAQGSNAVAPTGTKLYISFQSDANAGRLKQNSLKSIGVRPDKSHTLITTGYLQSRDMGMARSTLRHERGHDQTEIMMQKFLMAYVDSCPADSLGKDADKIQEMARYAETQADSLGFARDNAQNNLIDTDPQNLSAIRRLKMDYQTLCESVAGFTRVTASRIPADVSQQETASFESAKKTIAAYQHFDDDMTESDHPGDLNRIYYILIEQKRAKELCEHGKTTLYEQYGDLLPKPPVLTATPQVKSYGNF